MTQPESDGVSLSPVTPAAAFDVSLPPVGAVIDAEAVDEPMPARERLIKFGSAAFDEFLLKPRRVVKGLRTN